MDDFGIKPYDALRALTRPKSRTLYPLPNPVDNGERLCVKIYIPNHPAHRRAFLGAIFNLTRWYSWERDEAKTGRLASRVWQEVFTDLLEHFYDGCDDCPGEERCIEYAPDSGIIDWFPNDPFTQPNLIGEGYNFPAWYKATDLSNTLLGTKNGDVLTDLTRFPPGSLPTIIPASGLPRFRVNFSGEATVRLHLVNVFAGAIAQVTVDDDILSARFVDVNRDILAVPPETQDIIVVEIPVTGMGQHHIDCIIVSQVNDAIPYLHHGGGLRKVEICGGDALMLDKIEFRQNPANECQLQYRNEAGGEWLLAYDFSLCPQEVVVSETINQRTTNTTIINNQRLARYDGTPQSINPNTFTTNFNGSGSTQDDTALCMAVRVYVEQQMVLYLNLYRSLSGIAAVFTGFAYFLGGPIAGMIGGIATAIAGTVLAEIEAAAADQNALKEVICDLVDALKGDAVSEANFQAAVAGLANGTGNRDTIVKCLKNPAARRETYLWFLDMLGEAGTLAGAGVNDCPCQDCTVQPVKDPAQSDQGTITALGDCQWTIASQPGGPTGHYIQVSLSEPRGACALVVAVDNPQGGVPFYTLCGEIPVSSGGPVGLCVNSFAYTGGVPFSITVTLAAC